MADEKEHVQKLIAARVHAVKARRQVAEELAKDYKRGRTEEMREMFVKIQETIYAIDDAIEDEKESPSTIRIVDKPKDK
jgi:hypothetical protein